MKIYNKIASCIILFFVIICLEGCNGERMPTDEKLPTESVENGLGHADEVEANDNKEEADGIKERDDEPEASQSVPNMDSELQYYVDDFDYSPYLKKTWVCEEADRFNSENRYLSFIFTRLENGHIEGYFSVDSYCYNICDSVCELFVYEYPDFSKFGHINGYVKDGTAQCTFDLGDDEWKVTGSMDITFLDNGQLRVIIDYNRINGYASYIFFDGEYHYIVYDLSYINDNISEDMTHIVLKDNALAISTAYWEDAYFVPAKIDYGRFYYKAYIVNTDDEILYDLGAFPLDSELDCAYSEDINGDGLMDIRVVLINLDGSNLIYCNFYQTQDGLFEKHYDEERIQDNFDYSQYLKKTWIAEDYKNNKSYDDKTFSDKRLCPSFIFTKLENGQIEGYFNFGICDLERIEYPDFSSMGYIHGTVNNGTAQCIFSFGIRAEGSMEIVFLEDGKLEATVTYKKNKYGREMLLDGKYYFDTYDLDYIVEELAENTLNTMTLDTTFEIITEFWEDAYFVLEKVEYEGFYYVAYIVNKDGEISYDLGSLGWNAEVEDAHPEDVNGDGLTDIVVKYFYDDELVIFYQTEDGLFD